MIEVSFTVIAPVVSIYQTLSRGERCWQFHVETMSVLQSVSVILSIYQLCLCGACGLGPWSWSRGGDNNAQVVIRCVPSPPTHMNYASMSRQVGNI